MGKQKPLSSPPIKPKINYAVTAKCDRKRYIMTKREFLNAIANGTINAEITEYASAELIKMDEANEKRKNKPSKKAEENAPILASIFEALTDTPTITSDIATAVGVSTPKASALLRQLVAEGKAVQSEVKVPKKGVQKAYALVSVEDAE